MSVMLKHAIKFLEADMVQLCDRMFKEIMIRILHFEHQFMIGGRRQGHIVHILDRHR